jgi:hypothetical protein
MPVTRALCSLATAVRTRAAALRNGYLRFRVNLPVRNSDQASSRGSNCCYLIRKGLLRCLHLLITANEGKHIRRLEPRFRDLVKEKRLLTDISCGKGVSMGQKLGKATYQPGAVPFANLPADALQAVWKDFNLNAESWALDAEFFDHLVATLCTSLEADSKEYAARGRALFALLDTDQVRRNLVTLQQSECPKCLTQIVLPVYRWQYHTPAEWASGWLRVRCGSWCCWCRHCCRQGQVCLSLL